MNSDSPGHLDRDSSEPGRAVDGTSQIRVQKVWSRVAFSTVNDVVVTLCASALRSWLAERDELPEQPLVRN